MRIRQPPDFLRDGGTARHRLRRKALRHRGPLMMYRLFLVAETERQADFLSGNQGTGGKGSEYVGFCSSSSVQ